MSMTSDSGLSCSPNFFERSLIFPGRGVPLHAMLTSCGRQLANRHTYDWDGLRRGEAEFAVWQFTIDGRGRLDVGGVSRALEAGDAMLVVIPDKHRYFLPADSLSWEFIYICLAGREALRLCKELIVRRGNVARVEASSRTALLAASILEKVKAGEIATQFEASSCAYQFVMSLLVEHLPSEPSESERPSCVRDAIEFCRKHLAAPIGVAEMARSAGLSRHHFSPKIAG